MPNESPASQLIPAPTFELYEMIDATEFARRLAVPKTWVLDHTRHHVADTIPHMKLGKYVRFRWGSPEVGAWLARHMVVGPPATPKSVLPNPTFSQTTVAARSPRYSGRQGNGYVFRKGANWYLRYRETTYGTDGEPCRVQRCRKLACAAGETRSRKAARQLADIFLGLSEIRPPDVSFAMTMETFMERIYFPAVQVENENSTYRSYINIWNRYLVCARGIRLIEIRTATIENIMRSVASKFDLSQSSYRNIKHLLAAALAHARRNGYLNSDTDPTRDAKTPQGKMPGFTHAYTVEETRRILDIVPEPATTLAAIAAFTGVRKSELLALKWENYDGNQILITEKFTHGKLGTPKFNSQGIIPVAGTLRRYLDSHRIATGSPVAGYIFRNSDDKPMSIDRLTREVVRPALKKAGIPWYGWHAFRRGFATNLFHLRVADRIIQQLLRHKDIATTMNVYVKAVGADGREAVSKLDQEFRGVWKSGRGLACDDPLDTSTAVLSGAHPFFPATADTGRCAPLMHSCTYSSGRFRDLAHLTQAQDTESDGNQRKQRR